MCVRSRRLVLCVACEKLGCYFHSFVVPSVYLTLCGAMALHRLLDGASGRGHYPRPIVSDSPDLAMTFSLSSVASVLAFPGEE